MTKKRASLTPEHAEMLVFLYVNLFIEIIHCLTFRWPHLIPINQMMKQVILNWNIIIPSHNDLL